MAIKYCITCGEVLGIDSVGNNCPSCSTDTFRRKEKSIKKDSRNIIEEFKQYRMKLDLKNSSIDWSNMSNIMNK